ncbi:unnamed protein product [Mycena citricolor]|uniref:Uncharacterized protein n=1 Tax=Mycena citricolor TaxID=2018698 RepID=A0AAD2K2N2_9AGAR|nr:unnamed protein product [Mycena citricolor]CAK5263201.1 unnamed protein product [Mycena citricolor]CAK5275276.1 unnamed protein product [Mycena citricolor]
MLSNSVGPRPRPPGRIRRSVSSTMQLGSSPPPSYTSSLAVRSENVTPSPKYLGSPLPATLQMVELGEEDADWLNEKSREELTELLLKAGDLIKERETGLSLTSALRKTLHESNVSLKDKHDALVARLPSTPPLLSPHVSFSESPESSPHDLVQDSDRSPRVYLKRHSRKISVSPADLSHLADQNAELVNKIDTLESEALATERSSRRALKQLEKELQLLRDELEKTQARSEQLEKNAQVDTEKIVEEMLRKKKERQARFRSMRRSASAYSPGSSSLFGSEVRDFAPPPFSLSPSRNVAKSRTDYDSDEEVQTETEANQPSQTLVSQLLSKIRELEDTNSHILQQQSETADKLQAVQRETESISKVYECFNVEHGVEWEMVGEAGKKTPLEGTIRFKSFRRSLEIDPDDVPSINLPRSKARKSIIGLFEGPSSAKFDRPRTPELFQEDSELSPLKFDPNPLFESTPIGPSLHSELGDDGLDPFYRGSVYDLSFSPNGSPSPLPGRSIPGEFRQQVTPPDTPIRSGLLLSVEPTSPSSTVSNAGSLRDRNRARNARMAQALSLRTNRWVDGRFSSQSPGSLADELVRSRVEVISARRVSLPQRLATAFEVVMENFTRTSDDDQTGVMSPVSDAGDLSDKTIVLQPGGRKHTMVAILLEVWLWLQFAIIILVFLWAMARRGPKSVLAEADRRAVVSRR